jgi:hypothetical protein
MRTPRQPALEIGQMLLEPCRKLCELLVVEDR